MSNVQDFSAYVFFYSFYGFWSKFQSLIHFELILVYGGRRWSSFIFPHVSVQFFQHHLLNKLSSAHCVCLLLLLNIFMPVPRCFDCCDFIVYGMNYTILLLRNFAQVWMCNYNYAGERKELCVCVCVCERERERVIARSVDS